MSRDSDEPMVRGTLRPADLSAGPLGLWLTLQTRGPAGARRHASRFRRPPCLAISTAAMPRDFDGRHTSRFRRPPCLAISTVAIPRDFDDRHASRFRRPPYLAISTTAIPRDFDDRSRDRLARRPRHADPLAGAPREPGAVSATTSGAGPAAASRRLRASPPPRVGRPSRVPARRSPYGLMVYVWFGAARRTSESRPRSSVSVWFDGPRMVWRRASDVRVASPRIGLRMV
jgi:hypothetical protein